MSGYNDRRRDLKRPYRKKAFQNNMSLASNTVQSHPLPPHSYSTTTHQQTSPVRKGIDPRTYDRIERPNVEALDESTLINSANYPWHLVPRGSSANVIARVKRNWDTVTGGTNVGDGEYYDALVLNVADVSGATPSSPANAAGTGPTDRGDAPDMAATTEGFAPGSVSAGANNGENTRFPDGGGSSSVGVSGTIRIAGQGEVFKIASFGHSEIGASNLSGATAPAADTPFVYQIWIDGSLFMEWQNFQWSAVTPKADQWHFDQPLVISRQIVFRVINQTGQTLDAGESEFCFSGWTETLSEVVDIAHTQLEHS